MATQVQIEYLPDVILAEPFPPASACKFCGSCSGCEHLVAVIDCDGRRVPVYGPGLEETRQLVTRALARLLMDRCTAPTGPPAVAGPAKPLDC